MAMCILHHPKAGNRMHLHILSIATILPQCSLITKTAPYKIPEKSNNEILYKLHTVSPLHLCIHRHILFLFSVSSLCTESHRLHLLAAVRLNEKVKEQRHERPHIQCIEDVDPEILCAVTAGVHPPLIKGHALSNDELTELQNGDHELELEAVAQCGRAVIAVHHRVDEAVPAHEHPVRCPSHDHLQPARKHCSYVMVHLQRRRFTAFPQQDPRVDEFPDFAEVKEISPIHFVLTRGGTGIGAPILNLAHDLGEHVDEHQLRKGAQ